MIVFQRSADGTTFILRQGRGYKTHHHHVHNDEEDLKVATSSLPEDERKLAVNILDAHASAATVKRVLQQRGSGNLTTDQIGYIQKLAEERGEGRENHRTEEEGGKTPAEKILAYLEKNNISHVALYDEPDSELLTVTKPRTDSLRKARVEKGNPGGKMKVIRRVRRGDSQFETRSQEVEVESFVNEDEGVHGAQRLDEYRRRERARLIVEGNGRKRLLLAVAWSTDAMRTMFGKFPEVMAGDTTMQSNRERRPLWNLSGKTSSNNTFTALCAFLPSQSRWAFDYVYRFAMPAILPSDALRRLRLLITDGDTKLYKPFTALIERVYPNARHALCSWHLIDRGLRRVVHVGKFSDLGGDVFSELKAWLYSWTRDIETTAEFEVSKSFFSSGFRNRPLSRPSTRSTSSKLRITSLLLWFRCDPNG